MRKITVELIARIFATACAAWLLDGCASIHSLAPTQEEWGPRSPFPGSTWTHVDPAEEGFSPDGVDRAVAYARREGSTSGMIVRNGCVVAAWGDVSRKSNLHSARKSFMSALIGIEVARGRIHLDDTLAQLGIDDNEPSLSSEEKQATVRMLIEARSGVYHPTAYETAQMQATKPPRYSHLPGCLR